MNNEMPSSAFNRVVSVTIVKIIRFSDCICTPSGKIFHHRLSTTLPVGSVDHAGAARARTHRQRISGLFSHVISSSGPSWKEEQKPIHSSHPVSPNKIIHSLLFPFFFVSFPPKHLLQTFLGYSFWLLAILLKKSWDFHFFYIYSSFGEDGVIDMAKLRTFLFDPDGLASGYMSIFNRKLLKE